MWDWVTPFLGGLGWSVVAPDLPGGDESAGHEEYADVVESALRASGEWDRLVVVGQSLGSFTAIALADRVPVDHLVYVCAMIPAAGETSGDWWENTGQATAMRDFAIEEGRDPDAPWDDTVLFLHDTPPDVLEQVLAHGDPDQAMTPFSTPNTWTAWKSVPSTVIAGSLDRMFPLEFQRRVAQERLGVEPIVLESGHLPAYSRPRELAGAIASAVESAR